MIRSMTGFARGEEELSARWRAEVLVRSVNHRNLDLQLRIREEAGELESELRRRVAEVCRRGRVEVALRLRTTGTGAAPSIDADALEGAWRQLERMALERRLPKPADVSALLALPGIVSAVSDGGENRLGDDEREALLGLVERTLAAWDSERQREGGALAEVLERLREEIARRVEELVAGREGWSGDQVEAFRERVRTLADGVAVEPGRLEQEIALLAEKWDVTEELERLKIHLERARELLGEAPEDEIRGGHGKPLDFLAQELSREVSTCGAKLRHPDATALVLELKGLIEKLREQVQNVE